MLGYFWVKVQSDSYIQHKYKILKFSAFEYPEYVKCKFLYHAKLQHKNRPLNYSVGIEIEYFFGRIPFKFYDGIH